MVGFRVEAHVVGTSAQIDALDCAILCALEHPHQSIAAIGDKQRVRGPCIAQSLRSFGIGNDMYDLTRFKVDNANAVILELGDKQAMPRQVHRHMIETASYIAELDFALEDQSFLSPDRTLAEENHRDGDKKRKFDPHDRDFSHLASTPHSHGWQTVNSGGRVFRLSTRARQPFVGWVGHRHCFTSSFLPSFLHCRPRFTAISYSFCVVSSESHRTRFQASGYVRRRCWRVSENECESSSPLP